MKFCDVCGRHLKDQDRFCDKCGASQTVTAERRVETVPRVEIDLLSRGIDRILPKGTKRDLAIVLVICATINLAYWSLFPYAFRLIDQYSHVSTLWDSGFFQTVAFEYSRLAVKYNVFPYTAPLPGYPFDTLEYPFLAGYLFYALYLVSRGSFSAYVTIFQAINVTAEVGVGGLVFVIARRFVSSRMAFLGAILYSLTPSMLFFTFSRYDSISTFFSLLAVSQFITKKYRCASIFATIGAFLRYYPAILLVLFLKYGWTQHFGKKYYRDVIGISAVLGLIIVLPLVVLKPTGIIRLLSFSASFPWNWESVWGPIDRFVRPFFPQLKFFYDNQAWMRVPFAILLLSVPLLSIRDCRDVVTGYALALIYWLNTAWLVSPQYAVWIYPLLLVLSRNKKFLTLTLLFGIIITVEIPSPFFYVLSISEFYLAVSASAIRIVILAVLGLILFLRLEKNVLANYLAKLRAKWQTED